MNKVCGSWVSRTPAAPISSPPQPARVIDLPRGIACGDSGYGLAGRAGAIAGVLGLTRAFHNRTDSANPIAATGIIAIGQACQLLTTLAAAVPFSGSKLP